MSTLSVTSMPVDVRLAFEILDDLNGLTSFARALDTVLIHGEQNGMDAEDITAACLLSQYLGSTLGSVATDLRALLDHVKISATEGEAE